MKQEPSSARVETLSLGLEPKRLMKRILEIARQVPLQAVAAQLSGDGCFEFCPGWIGWEEGSGNGEYELHL